MHVRSRNTYRALVLASLLAACGGGGRAPSSSASSGGEAAGGVPAGYHAITPYLVVADIDGALAFYERALAAQRSERLEGPNGVVLHAELRLGDSVVMLGPENAEHHELAPSHAGGTNGTLYVYVEDVDAALTRAVDAGAALLSPPEDMFWGDRHAQFRDPSGHRWSFISHRIDLTPEEMERRMAAVQSAMAAGQPPPSFEGGTPTTEWQAPGYHTVTPSLVVSGPDAIDWYVRAFGATARDRSVTPEGRLMHGEIEIDGSIVMLSSAWPEMEPDVKAPADLSGTPLSLVLYTPNVDAAHARAVGAGATPHMEPMDMFWGDRWSALSDASGQPWSIATHVRDVSEEEMRAGAAAMER